MARYRRAGPFFREVSIRNRILLRSIMAASPCSLAQAGGPPDGFILYTKKGGASVNFSPTLCGILDNPPFLQANRCAWPPTLCGLNMKEPNSPLPNRSHIHRCVLPHHFTELASVEAGYFAHHGHTDR